ncbi:MAG: carboxypeptidase-like regulatory domain-containing protein [Thermoguttaceae bacterium]
MKYTQFGYLIVIFLGLFCFVGCGPKLTKVTGIVTLDGTPVEGASVSFTQKANPSVMATAKTDASGKYTLLTFVGGDKVYKGVAPGSYMVSIIKKETDGPPPEDTSTMTEEEKINYRMSLSSRGMNVNFIYHIPQKYEIAEHSELTAEVPSSGSVVIDFPLNSD